MRGLTSLSLSLSLCFFTLSLSKDFFFFAGLVLAMCAAEGERPPRSGGMDGEMERERFFRRHLQIYVFIYGVYTERERGK